MLAHSFRLCLATAFAAAACAERDRPLPSALLEPVQLGVELLAPRSNQTVLAGRSMTIRVRAQEASGRLEGVGFLAHLVTHRSSLLDSVAVRFPRTTDTTYVFSLHVPEDLPSNAQIDIVGIALGPAAAHSTTQPRGIIVLQCTAGAAWC